MIKLGILNPTQDQQWIALGEISLQETTDPNLGLVSCYSFKPH